MGYKISITIGLSLLAIILAFVFGTVDRIGCCIAMLLSTAGDIALMIDKKIGHSTEKFFLSGMAFFIMVHVTYGITFFKLLKEKDYFFFNRGAWSGTALTSFVIIVMTIFLICFENKNIDMKLYLFCIGYEIIIGFNCTIIFSFSVSSESWQSLAAIGILSFFISDIFIGIEKLFKVKSKTLRKLVWIFYPIGQLIIIICG